MPKGRTEGPPLGYCFRHARGGQQASRAGKIANELVGKKSR